MLLDDIALKLENASIGTRGTNLFVGYMPEDPDACVAVIETPGIAPTRVMGETGVAEMEHAGFQILCRNARDEYETARSKAHDVYKLLGSSGAETINSTSYHQWVAISSVFSVGIDANERPMIACNYMVSKAVHA